MKGKSNLEEVYITAELGKAVIENDDYKDYKLCEYAIFKFNVTCDSDPRYHLKYLMINAYPFMAYDFKMIPKIRCTYKSAPEDNMFVQALTEITDLHGNKTFNGWWASKEQIEKFEKIKVAARY